MTPKISVVSAAFNEAQSLPELVEKVSEAMRGMGVPWEMIVVDDGSTDRTFEVLRDLRAKYPELRSFTFLRNYGKSAALDLGIDQARGERILTLDADLQDDPAEFPALLAKLDEGYDLVSGWKQVRRDPLTKTLPSKLFNGVTGIVSGLRLHDFNCGLKAYRTQVAQDLPLYGELHRFLPALAHWKGYRVTELPVRHHPRRHGQSKFGARRFVNGFLDLLTVTFVHSGRFSPLHVFGRVGLLLGFTGVGIFGAFVVSWLLGHPVRTRPIFFIGLILMILAIQFISLGLLGELVVKGQSKVNYRFREDA